MSVVSILLNGSIANDVLTTQFHVKEQGAAKPIRRRARRRQDESVLKKVLDIDRRFIDAISASKTAFRNAEISIRREICTIRCGFSRNRAI